MSKILIKTMLLLLFIGQPMLAFSNELEGKWRGILEVQRNVSLAIGINISQQNGEMTLTFDSPNQGMFDRSPTSFNISGNQITFKDKSLNIDVSGKLRNGKLETEFTQGRTYDISFEKLQPSDLARLQFEHDYGGALQVDKTTKLPLVLRVAVIKGGYLAKLDSPAQKSFGIPISEFAIDDKQLSFTSKLISASFQGQSKADGYTGTFSQGYDFELTLTKGLDPMQDKTALNNRFGDHGGAAAVVEGDKVQTRFYSDHNEQTLYEIGSVTKTMTAYLLAQQVAAKQLTEQAQLRACYQGAPEDVSLFSLATHSSGFPRLPSNLFDQANPNDPYAHFNGQNLTDAITTLQPQDKQHLYSNFAFGALAECLAKLADSNYEALMQQNIFKPMQMPSSYVATPSHKDDEQLSQGHNSVKQPVANWHFQSLAGAGAVVSNLTDMTQYLTAMMTMAKTDPALAQLLFEPRLTLDSDNQQALGWMIKRDKQGKKIAWHNGQTAGYTSFVGFYLDGSKGVVLLNNQAYDVTEEGFKLLLGTGSLFS